ncbi:hypothetical protein [Devosia sp.]|uniref:hypothetical protein n=1 Tax=Devosia sp. TaxID=1871048 RepID=UPI002FCA99AF
MKLSVVGALAAGLCTALLGAWCVYQESAPVLRGGSNSFERLAATSANDLGIGLSLLSQSTALRDCQTVLLAYESARMAVMPDDFKAGLPSQCAGLAQRVLQTTPIHGFAELVLAQVADIQGDAGALDRHLQRSQAMAPSEARVILPRVSLAEAHIEALSDPTLERHQQDIGTLLKSSQGLWLLASLYVRDEAARGRIQAALPTASPADQSRFLWAVRQTIDLRGRSS